MDKQELREMVGQRLKLARKAKGMTQDDLALLVPNMDKATISKFEHGHRQIPRDRVEQFAQVLDVSPVYLLGYGEEKHVNFDKTIPPAPSNQVSIDEFKRGTIIGDVACGRPINCEENEDFFMPIGADTALYCRGDSMINAGICDGDIVYLKYVTWYDQIANGKIAAVAIGDDYEYTLKRWYWYPEKITLELVPENDDYKPMIFKGEENLKQIHLLGVAVGVTTML